MHGDIFLHPMPPLSPLEPTIGIFCSKLSIYEWRSTI